MPDSVHILFFTFLFIGLRSGVGERSIDLLLHLFCIYWLTLVCALTGD